MIAHIVLKEIIQGGDTRELWNPVFCGRRGILMGVRKGALEGGERKVTSNLKLAYKPAVGF